MTINHTSTRFDAELDAMRESVQTMSAHAVTQLDRVTSALTAPSFALLSDVADTEREINAAQNEIDAMCARIVAKRQPAADDLRLILSTMRIVGEIERIGDEAKKILRSLSKLPVHDLAASINDLVAMSALAKQMIEQAQRAFLRKDATGAAATSQLDETLDAHYRSAIDRLTEQVSQNPGSAKAVLECAFVARSLERCGDHAKNVAESVIAIVRGQDVRHHFENKA